MDYLQDAFPFPQHHQQQQQQQHHHQQQQQHHANPQPQLYYQAMGYPTYMLQQHVPMEEMYIPYPSSEYIDFMHPAFMREDYDDMGEISTRPRLTREQVEVLEAQFQAQPKPNSAVKHQLAIQTKLSLARVANWFQNRRAKAKQLKKQEEFEQSQAMGQAMDGRPASNGTTDSNTSSDKKSDVTAILTSFDSEEPSTDSVASSSTSVSRNSSIEAGWASVQRALGAAEAAQQQQRAQQQAEDLLSMPPPEVPQSNIVRQPSLRTTSSGQSSNTSEVSDWSMKVASAKAWSSPQMGNDRPFDFSFEPLDASASSSHSAEADASTPEFPQQTYMLSPDMWQDTLHTPKGIDQQHLDQHASLQSPGHPLPTYSESRRGSEADELTTNFGSFALAGSSPHPMVSVSNTEAIRQPDSQVDLAARRKRPRPAALTSASLRSRSYGALTSVSPTFRPGSTTPGAHSVRHVKSQGHSLNAHYSGVRKASSAQRSPMHVSNFAEAEAQALQRLLAQQSSAAQSQAAASIQSNEPPMVSISSEANVNNQISPAEKPAFTSNRIDLANQYQLAATQHLTLSAASPPTTPFGSEFINPGLVASGIPLSAPPQYASFPDYTPPYSAGPLTNSSWSDAPLTSPELPTFPSLSYNPTLSLSPSIPDNMTSSFQQFVLPSDLKQDYSLGNSLSDPKTTEFWIHEFPNQKAEHAHVAQQLASQKPKSYVFANTAPSDYDHA